MKSYPVTVFTPTYNRAYTLTRLYESLKRQTVQSFEWIIVDDGSMDETANLIFPWIESEANFEIIYIRVKTEENIERLIKQLNSLEENCF